MQFRILGPLEVLDQNRPVVLRGTKQRATLGFLLLHANRVVPTSQLLNALWRLDEAPTTARKILQNAVYGIRGLLTPRAPASQPDTYAQTGPALLTQTAGYMMRVPPEHVDVHCFHRRVAQGREQRAQAPQQAAALLREALGLWRGPALADVVEAGIDWPELAALEKTRLDVMEDYFDAQLACGRHYDVLPELETMVQAEPLRERSCGQLMLALYRCGRQADALNVYTRLRAELVENLGLEPARELQDLQQAILTQDLSLSPGRGTRLPEPAGAGRPREAVRLGVRTGTGPVTAAAGPTPSPDRNTKVRPADPARRRVGVLSVGTRLAPTLGGGARANRDDLLDGTTLMVREQIERFGGKVTAAIGSVSLAVFGLDDPGEEDAGRAVLAALALRDVLDGGAESAPLTVHAAVTVGDVLLRYADPRDAPTVVGTVLDESHTLLSEVPAGEVWVHDQVRRATVGTIAYRKLEDAPHLWRATGRRESPQDLPDGDGAWQLCELDVLRGLVRRTWYRSVPHLVTVLGEAGAGKSRLLEDFRDWTTHQPDGVLFLTGHAPAAPDDDPLQAQAEMLTAYCGIRPGDDAEAALVRKARSLFRSERTVDWMVPRLLPLVRGAEEQSGAFADDDRLTDTLHAWCMFFQEVARRRPVVLAVDDLHRAPDRVLDSMEECAGLLGSCRLFVVVTAGPELLLRRPSWGGGKRHATTVTLDHPERVTTEHLAGFLRSTAGN
ncbi:BTAD domain-containing putative transcriptional regulator [Streptomyces sp. NPDC026672]|uniref:BTAD domain-containing putative transcriptional regulator n=1 Tax=unclassified Streptomyces TaxID=2593676 RepID=UPI0033E003A8